MNKLSVVIPHSGSTTSLENILRVLDQQEVTPLEVIVVCNGARASVAYQARKFSEKFPVLFVDAAVGANSARNAGWRVSQGQWVLFLDDDCIPLGQNFLKRAQESTLVLGKPFGGTYVLREQASALEIAYNNVQMAWLMNHSVKGRAYHLLGGCMCFPKTILERFPFDEKWLFGGTELEHQMHLYEGGIELRLQPDLKVLHLCDITFFSFLGKALKQGRGSAAALFDREKPPQFENLEVVARLSQQAFGEKVLTTLYHFFFQLGARYYFEYQEMRFRPLAVMKLFPLALAGTFARGVFNRFKSVLQLINLKRNQVQHETWKRWRDKDRSQ